jgi:hypothetical protein
MLKIVVSLVSFVQISVTRIEAMYVPTAALKSSAKRAFDLENIMAAVSSKVLWTRLEPKDMLKDDDDVFERETNR